MNTYAWPAEAVIINECRAAYCQEWRCEYIPPAGQKVIQVPLSSMYREVYTSNSWVAKIDRDSDFILEGEWACMQYIRSFVLLDIVQVPKVYPKIIHDEIDGQNVYYLVMERIQAKTLHRLKTEGNMSPKTFLAIIDKIAAALVHIRQTAPPPPEDLLLPLRASTGQRNVWSARAPCFNVYDNVAEAHTIFTIRAQLKRLILEKAGPTFEKEGRTQELLHYLQAETTFIHGDISEDNVMITEDEGIVLIDYGYSFWGPSWWELAAILFFPGYSKDYVEHLREAMEKRGVRRDPVAVDILAAIRNWLIEHGEYLY